MPILDFKESTPILNEVANPRFTNASKLFADCPRDALKVVAVFGKTANITNGFVLIRRYVDVPDGAYNINADGSLSPTRYEHGLCYPNIEMIRPPFNKMHPFSQLNKDIIGKMIQFCHEAASVDGTVVLTSHGMYMLQNPSISIPFLFGYPKTLKINPTYFGIALVEMLQYSQVYLLQEDDDSLKTPLVIGKDWGSCALIMPLK